MHNNRRYLFTSESVAEGHPDKIADQISDAILDAFLAEEPAAKVACETFVADHLVVIAGEFRTARSELFSEIQSRAEAIARQVLRDIGYLDSDTGIDPEYLRSAGALQPPVDPDQQGHHAGGRRYRRGRPGADVRLCLRRNARPDAVSGVAGASPGQAPGRAAQIRRLAVAASRREKPGDGGVRRPARRRDRECDHLHPDRTRPRPRLGDPGNHARNHRPAGAVELRTPTFKLWVNPAGPFEIGGPNGDTGLTGRKIIVDTYGGSCPHGGGAFSGKDPTKVDRSAAYMARYIAKNLVAAGYAKRCLVQLAYAIGVAEPVSLLIDTYGTGSLPDETLEHMVRNTFQLTPRGIIESLQLQRPIYRQTAAYGHFGRAEPEFTWERVDQAQKLAEFAG